MRKSPAICSHTYAKGGGFFGRKAFFARAQHGAGFMRGCIPNRSFLFDGVSGRGRVRTRFSEKMKESTEEKMRTFG